MSRFPDIDQRDRSIPIVLASGSPRRLELTERIGFDPQVRVSEIPEERGTGETGIAYTARLAAEKAADVAHRISDEEEPPDWMLAADTVVTLDDDVLEKPDDEREAEKMVRAMAGRWHAVCTSFCWKHRRTRDQFVETVSTNVRLRDLSDELIERYVATEEPMDKAGGYGIQDYGSLLVRELRGSYFNVVGLPLCEVVEALENMGMLDIHPLLSPEDDREPSNPNAS